MKNQKIKGAVVWDESTANPHQTMERVALYNQDGTPYAPTSGPSLIVLGSAVQVGFVEVSEAHIRTKEKILDMENGVLYQGNGTDTPALLERGMIDQMTSTILFIKNLYATMSGYINDTPYEGGSIFTIDSYGASAVVSGLTLNTNA